MINGLGRWSESLDRAVFMLTLSSPLIINHQSSISSQCSFAVAGVKCVRASGLWTAPTSFRKRIGTDLEVRYLSRGPFAAFGVPGDSCTQIPHRIRHAHDDRLTGSRQHGDQRIGAGTRGDRDIRAKTQRVELIDEVV